MVQLTFLALSEITLRWIGLALLTLVIGALAAYARSANKTKIAECPRCHGRIPGLSGRCPRCGWSEDRQRSGRPRVRGPFAG
jgi:hypothetical protein